MVLGASAVWPEKFHHHHSVIGRFMLDARILRLFNGQKIISNG
jgi:hypothetical protein